MHQSDMVINFTILLGAALIGGMIAHRLRQPVILGYIIVGIGVGPHALGLVDDLVLIEAAAVMGVALLMFTLGLEVSFAQLRQVGRAGLWGGIAQILATFVLGAALGSFAFKWSLPQSILFGLLISLSSTMVCFKILMDRGELDSKHGQIMIAILILQDISVILITILMPLLGGGDGNILVSLGIALAKVVLFTGAGIVLGRWVLPWIMGAVGGVRARELLLLTVLVLCFGAAIGTQIVGLSAIFGAFLIGIVLRETTFAHQALAEITPLRDVFAALFFVSLGMLLDIKLIIEYWPLVMLSVVLIIVIKFSVVFGVVRFFGYGASVALMAGAGLFQIGEFSFILAQGGADMGIISHQWYSLIIGSAIVTMLLTPLFLGIVSRLISKPSPRPLKAGAKVEETHPLLTTDSERSTGHIVIAGFGRVGENILRGLQSVNIPCTVIEIDPELVSKLRDCGTTCVYGDASNFHVISKANLDKAQALVVTYPDPLAVLTTVKAALSINPRIKIVARVHRIKEAEQLRKLGVKELISPEYEASIEFVRRILPLTGLKKADIRRSLSAMQQDREVAEFSPYEYEGE